MTCDCQVRGGEEKKGMGVEISRDKLLYTGWINNKAYCIAQGAIFNILCQTIMEKNMKKNICLTESLCCTEEINTIL